MLTVADILLNSSKRSPDAPAIVVDGRSMSYSTLLENALSVGSTLQEIGLNRGDVVVTALQNHSSAAVLHWACQLYGFVICPVNWRSTGSELGYFVADTDAKILFFDDASREAAQDCSSAAEIVAVDAEPSAWARSPLRPKRNIAPLPDLHEDDISVILYTSGTTGRGKGVPRSHRAERAAALAQIGQNALLFGDVTLGVMPLYHTMGVRILLSSALLSGTFVCQPKFDASQTLELIADHAVSSLYLVPTLYHDMTVSLEKCPRNYPFLKHLGFAGASMSDGLLKRVSEQFQGLPIVNHYGSSEIYTYTITQDAALKPGSSGKPGLNSQIDVIPLGSSDISARVGSGAEGQVIASLRSPEAFTGYLNRADADAKAIQNGWYLTGDVGYLDEDGDLFLTGRVDDMIITGGENVMPVEIESVLSLHPGVSEAVVVGKPDNRLGQKITAFIVPKVSLEPEMLDRHCRSSGLPGYRCPKDYSFVEAIPKSPVGKILRRHL
ncbi:MAG: AMP-binding protein [Pseudomonadota bacterium]